uniref:C2H2-type domain-containing protein n=1 Tax=Angiostrongylus cantonensis TaxID=6313 RepID=A0A0K0DPB5_ANGCA
MQTNSGSHWPSLTSEQVLPVEDSGEIDDITEADHSFTSFSREVVSALQSINPTSSLFMGDIVLHDELDQQCHSSSIEGERFVSKQQESQESINSKETNILNSERCLFPTAGINEESVYNTGISHQSYIAGKDVVEDIGGNELPPLSSLTLEEQELNEKLDSSSRSPSEIVSLRNFDLENAFTMQSATAGQCVRRKRARSISEDSEEGATITPKEGSPNDVKNESGSSTVKPIVPNQIFRCHMPINHHHKNVHRDSPYMGALSIETREDLDELLVLWNQCFPDGFTQFEGEYVSHDNVQQFHMDQYAENEMEIKRKEEFTECVTHGTAMDESDYGSRPNIVHENYLDKAKMPSCLSFTNYLDASSSKEFPVTLSCSAICSTSGGNSFLQSNNFSKSCEGPNFVTNESESKKLEVFTVVASMTTVPCVEEDVQILFRHSDIVHEALHVDEKGKSVSCKPEELELRVSFSKFSHDLESLSNIGARAEQTCIQTVRRPAFGSMCKLFVDFKESVVDDKRVASRNNYVIMRRMSSVPKFYHCKIEGCKQCIRLRYGYGKQRLLEHVRAHWGKLLKKCKLCTFRASHAYKVYYHHKCKHSGSDFFQAESLETKEDMKELLQMWKLCFDAEPPRCLRPEASSAFCHRIVGFLHYRNKYFSATVYKLTLSVPNVMRRHPMKTFTMMMCDGCM